MSEFIECAWCHGEGEILPRGERACSPNTIKCRVCGGSGAITRRTAMLTLRAEREALGQPILSGRRPRFDRTAVVDMIGLRNAGWSYGQIAREFKASRSLVTKYIQGFRPQRWAA